MALPLQIECECLQITCNFQKFVIFVFDYRPWDSGPFFNAQLVVVCTSCKPQPLVPNVHGPGILAWYDYSALICSEKDCSVFFLRMHKALLLQVTDILQGLITSNRQGRAYII